MDTISNADIPIYATTGRNGGIQFMINEVVPSDPTQDILQMGIYITSAVKTPKSTYTIERSSIENSVRSSPTLK